MSMDDEVMAQALDRVACRIAMQQAIDRFVNWTETQPDGAALREALAVIAMALSGGYGGVQACDAALRVANAAARWEPGGRLAWTFAELAATWMPQERVRDGL